MFLCFSSVINEAGASIYSVSSEAQREMPSLDPNLRSAVSIARRLQDPMAELVKIDPKHIGVGLYQVRRSQGGNPCITSNTNYLY